MPSFCWACQRRPMILQTNGRQRFCEVLKSTGIIIGGILFLGGSALFLPGQDANLGAWMFLWGCALYIIIRAHDTGITMIRGGRRRCLDLTVSLLYLIGLLVFLVGSVYFLGRVALFDVGGVLFILGSLFFVLGSIVNVFQAFEVSRSKSSSTFLLSVLAAIVYCIGSSLFLCGRLVYLLVSLDPGADTEQLTRSLSIQCIAGSIFFVVGGILNCIRVIRTEENSLPQQWEPEEAPSKEQPRSATTLFSSAQSFDDIEDRPVRDLIDEIYVSSLKRPEHRPRAQEEDRKDRRLVPWLFPRSKQPVVACFPHRSSSSMTSSSTSEEPSTSGAS